MKQQLKQFLINEKVPNSSNVNYEIKDTELEILGKWLNLSNAYKGEFKDLQAKNFSTFDKKELPKDVQDLVSLALVLAPEFSTIAALSIITFTLSELFGQLRPKINDGVYSPDALGINYYSFVLSRSGAGKDQTYKALIKTFEKAYEFIDGKKIEELEEKARKSYEFQMKQEDKDFDITSIKREDYAHLAKAPEQSTISMKSSRGGVTTSLNRLERVELGTKSLFSSELGLSMQSSPFVGELFELFSESYDMGSSTPPEYKGIDAKEDPVLEMYLNLLGISSPTIFLTDESVKRKLIPLISTALARRLFILFPQVKEDYENLVIPDTPTEVRELQAKNRILYKTLSTKLQDSMLAAVQETFNDRHIIFDDEAGELYQDYKAYTGYKSNIISTLIPSSITALEMKGRAFKLARVAALWALTQNKRVIDKTTLESAIYFAEHSAEHLSRFESMITMKEHDLLAFDYQQGIVGDVLPVDKALLAGYIKSATQSTIRAFLELLNSTMKGVATVSYSETQNAFKFIPTIRNDSVGDYNYSVTPVQSESDRDSTTFKTVRNGKTLGNIQAMTKVDTILSPFSDKDTTKFIIVDVEGSYLNLHVIHEYLKEYKHIISTQKDIEDTSTFTIVLPINEVITKKEYMYVVNSVSTELMLKIKIDQDNKSAVYNSYKESLRLGELSENLKDFDISSIKADYASNKPQSMPTRQQKDLTKTQQKKLATQALKDCEELINVIKASDNVLLTFADVSRDLKMNFVDEDSWMDMINMVNSLLIEPFNKSLLEKCVIEPFKGI